VQILSKQKGLSEVTRMELEREWVGEVGQVDAEIHYGMEIVKSAAGCELKERMVDGWLLPIHEARRERDCEFSQVAIRDFTDQ
jgi:midasin